MSLKPKVPDSFRTIAFRLTLWYAGIFSISSCVAFGLFYFLATQTIQDQVDQELMDKAGYFRTAIQRNGILGAQNLAVIEAQAAGEKSIFFRLLYPTGEVFASSHMSYWKEVSIDHHTIDRLLTKRAPVFQTARVEGHEQKARIMYTFVAHNAILQTGVTMTAHARFIRAFKTVFGVSMAFIVLFSAVSGYFLSGKALSGVEAITQTANTITGHNLDERVPETGSEDELDRLAITFNRMLDRISHLVKSIREMSDNIAHDLKSPLTRIRGFAELSLLQEDREGVEGYRNMAANTIEESDRLLDMINTMLVISRAEAGEGEFEFRPMDLSAMISEACELFVPVAEDKSLVLTREIQEGIVLEADSRMLQRAFSNLLDNAIKYTPEQGKVHVRVAARQGRVLVSVSDTGPGIEPDAREKIFERFYRTESSRTSPGTGLGLSLARTIARQHGGDVTVDSAGETGALFTMRLPSRNYQII